MNIKDGDIIEFLAISWDEGWEFDHPTVVLKPIIEYSPNGNSCEEMIEDMAISFCCNEDVEDDEFFKDECDWRGWKLPTLKKVAKERLQGKDTWKTKIREVVSQKIKFFKEGNEMEFEIIESIIV